MVAESLPGQILLVKDQITPTNHKKKSLTKFLGKMAGGKDNIGVMMLPPSAPATACPVTECPDVQVPFAPECLVAIECPSNLTSAILT